MAQDCIRRVHFAPLGVVALRGQLLNYGVVDGADVKEGLVFRASEGLVDVDNGFDCDVCGVGEVGDGLFIYFHNTFAFCVVFVCLVFSGLYKAIKFFPHNAGIKPDVRMIRGCHIPRPCVSCRIARLCLCVCVCFLFPIETVVVSRRSASGPPPTTITTLTDACRSTRFCHPLPLPLPFPLP